MVPQVKAWAIVGPVPVDAPVTPDCTTDQLNTVPVALLLNAIEVVAPEHIVDNAGLAVAEVPGSGLTVMLTVMEVAAQPFAVAVTV